MKVSYTRSYPIGAFLQEKIGFEIEVPDDCENPIMEVHVLKDFCDKAHKELNPGLDIAVDYSAIPGHPMNVQEPEKEAEDRNVAIDAYYQIINMKGASAKYLEKQRQHIEALNDSALTQHFNNKLKELQ